MSKLPSVHSISIEREARLRVRLKLGLSIHAVVFASVCALMLLVNLLTSPQVPWFWFPFGGWSLGLLLHGWAVHYRLNRRADIAVQRELDDMRRQISAG